jgi:hypothetical protein
MSEADEETKLTDEKLARKKFTWKEFRPDLRPQERLMPGEKLPGVPIAVLFERRQLLLAESSR